MTPAASGRGRPRRRRWRRRFGDWWYRYVQPPGSPNLWLVIIPLMLVGAVAVALLSGFLADAPGILFLMDLSRWRGHGDFGAGEL